jgi:hypothetical protein
MSVRTRAAGAIVAGLATLVLGAASRAPWTASPADRALLRLSWRVQSEAAEECRPLTEEEKADLPVHMRVPEVCEARAIPYLLQVAIDGATVVSDTVHGAGAREDRPITIFREIPLAAGTHDVRVSFAPTAEPDDDADEEADETVGVRLEYSATIDLAGREVALVTVDPGGRGLVRMIAP